MVFYEIIFRSKVSFHCAHIVVHVDLEFLLSNNLLYLFAVAGVPCHPGALPAALDQTAGLAGEGVVVSWHVVG